MRARTQALAGLALALCALALGACGADDEEPAGSTTQTTEQRDEAGATDTATETSPDKDSTAGRDESQGGGGGLTAPSKASGGEDSPGGAGDEIPASSQALITGRDGRLHPTVVRVPPFIAVRVQLISEDGVEYELEGDGHEVKAGGEIRSASTLIDGLRTGERVVLTGPQGKVTIVANAEPGP